MFTQYEHTAKVNALVDEVSAVLDRWGVAVAIEAPSAADASVDMLATLDAGARGAQRYRVVVKAGRVDGPHATAMALPSQRPLLLVADHVLDPAADALAARGVEFVDAAGNVRLSWEGLSVDVRGRRRQVVERPRSDPTASRAFTRAGVKVLFALLSWPDLAARPVREIAAVSGVALGTVHAVMGALRDGGYLYEARGRSGLNRAGELLDRWAEAYTVGLARGLDLGSFSVADWGRPGDLETSIVGAGGLIGGELAGARIDGTLRPTTATFYVDEVPGDVVARFRLRRDPAAGTVSFRRRFWSRREPGTSLVPAPLVYADLLSSGDPRQREHAERIRRVDDRLVQLDRT